MLINAQDSHRVVGKEKYGDTGSVVTYVVQQSKDQLAILKPQATIARIIQIFSSIFLPQGYPHSVSEDYLVYQAWDTVQAFASSITGTLATQSVLKGVGVGNENATPLAATVTWLLKDGTGMLGRIAFAWYRGYDLDCHSKRWRLIADFLNDVAIFLELIAQFFDYTSFIIIICFAGILKSIVGVAGGATRAALVQHQAQRNNLADVAAKDGSQETLVNLAALICCLIMLPVVGNNQSLVWMLFAIFSSLHLYANYMAISSVVMSTLNQSRFYILAHHYIMSGGEVLSQKVVNKKEPVFLSFRFPLKIRLGCSLSALTTSFSGLFTLEKLNYQSMYLLNFDKCRKQVDIGLHKDSKDIDQYKAYFQAVVICTCYDNVFKGISGLSFNLLDKITADLEQRKEGVWNVLELAHQFTEEEFPNFVNVIKKWEWKIDQSQLGADEWRLMWNVLGLDEKFEDT